jgi:peroxiredoxin
MFEFESAKLVNRVTLILHDGIIEHVFYPVFPPDENAGEVVAWLASGPV